MKVEVYAIKCPKCNCTIFSRARHDFRTCDCGSIHIDGGFDYTKIGFDTTMEPLKPFRMSIKSTIAELFEDWNKRKGRFGIIRHDKNLDLVLEV